MPNCHGPLKNLTLAAHSISHLPTPGRYALLALNFVVHGLLAPGVSATTRPDPQAKGLGEYLRSRIVAVPADLPR